jgi:hypothetical protein
MADQFALIDTTAPGFSGRGLMSTTRGDATVQAKGGEVKTAGEPLGGNSAIGVLAEVLGPGSGNALVDLNGTKVTTQGSDAYAVMSYTGFGGVAAGSATIRTTNATLETNGANAHGLLAANFSAGNVAPVSVTMTGGSVTTKGGNAYGIYAQAAGGTADVQVLSGASVSTEGATADAVWITSGSTATVTQRGTLSSASGDGIDVNGAAGGATITSSGDIIAPAAGAAVVRGSPAADTFTATAGALQGNTLMGNGADTVNLRGTVDVTQAQQFDGGTGADTLNIDGVSMRGFTGANNPANGSNLTLWEAINVQRGGTLTLTGNLLEAGSGASLTVDATSTLDAKGSPTGAYTVHGSLVNSGVATLADAPAAADDVLTVANNYSGAAGSSVALDTVLGDSSSASDRLVVQGNSSGTSVLKITNAGGTGAATTGDGILVVQVDGTSDATFELDGGTITAGVFEYSLHKVGNNWYLQSRLLPSAGTTAVPTLGQAALAMLAALMALLGGRRSRRAQP